MRCRRTCGGLPPSTGHRAGRTGRAAGSCGRDERESRRPQSHPRNVITAPRHHAPMGRSFPMTTSRDSQTLGRRAIDAAAARPQVVAATPLRWASPASRRSIWGSQDRQASDPHRRPWRSFRTLLHLAVGLPDGVG